MSGKNTSHQNGKEQKDEKDNRVTKTIIYSPKIHKSVAPLSQAVLVDKTLYVSGMLGLKPDGTMISGGVAAQTRMALDNLTLVLEAGGASLESVVKTTVLLADINDFAVVNQVYGEYFRKHHPARAAYQVGRLPLNALVEIECIALSGDVTVLEAGARPSAKL